MAHEALEALDVTESADRVHDRPDSARRLAVAVDPRATDALGGDSRGVWVAVQAGSEDTERYWAEADGVAVVVVVGPAAKEAREAVGPTVVVVVGPSVAAVEYSAEKRGTEVGG